MFPEKSLEATGRQPIDLEYIHRELAKPNVTLSLLHFEYEADSRANNKIPYSYRSLANMRKNTKLPCVSVENLEKFWRWIGLDP